jgi:hypothetical protein
MAFLSQAKRSRKARFWGPDSGWDSLGVSQSATWFLYVLQASASGTLFKIALGDSDSCGQSIKVSVFPRQGVLATHDGIDKYLLKILISVPDSYTSTFDSEVL